MKRKMDPIQHRLSDLLPDIVRILERESALWMRTGTARAFLCGTAKVKDTIRLELSYENQPVMVRHLPARAFAGIPLDISSQMIADILRGAVLVDLTRD
jgi:hypothetical protein